jgi:hypothetical protein
MEQSAKVAVESGSVESRNAFEVQKVGNAAAKQVLWQVKDAIDRHVEADSSRNERTVAIAAICFWISATWPSHNWWDGECEKSHFFCLESMCWIIFKAQCLIVDFSD